MLGIWSKILDIINYFIANLFTHSLQMIIECRLTHQSINVSQSRIEVLYTKLNLSW